MKNCLLPKISVVIPVYNQAIYVGDAIKSILNQTHKGNEIIVVNDGSTDNLMAALEPFKEIIRVITHSSNKGVAAARNTGIAESKYEVILFQDADDISEPNRVELCALAFKNPEVRYVRGLSQNFLEPGKVIPELLADKEGLDPKHCFSTCALSVRREFFNLIGLFDVNLKVAEDLDWEMRARTKGYEPVEINKLFVRRRLHADNISYLSVEEAATVRLTIFRKNLFSKKSKDE